MNQQELKHILSSKFDFEKWKDLLGTMFLKIDYLTKPIQIEAALVKSGGQVGVIRLDDGRSLGLFKFEVADNIKIARNRKGLRDIAIKYVDQDITHGALVFYYSEDQADYRLTFVSKQTSLNEDGEFVTKATAPKRYTFLLGENEPCTTAANRLLELINKKKSGSVYLADVMEAFSVERLNKDFFKGYKDQYGKFLNYIGEQSKANRDYVKKLLGRLVFLQFLQKKGWMGVPVNNTNWEGGDKNYLNNLIENYKGNNRLLSDVLEVLFFNTLNEKRDNDLADKILGENIKIPYLNGGLFDKDSLDKLDIDFPYDYFKELMEFFAMYNFTIDENDPDDAEVGVDPEMLGHIFENLLEDNKDKGAFYTPKEIVQYMSEESVSQYLKSHTPEEFHSAIDALIKRKDMDVLLKKKENAKIIHKLLREIKVCDPAIGSGAFPMGVLNVLFNCRHLLYPYTGSKDDFSWAMVKREIIQNNIYGVDIEKGAVDIARLRFWLALVVDETRPEPLPNLDFKIMQGNSLLEQYKGVDLSKMAELKADKHENYQVSMFDDMLDVLRLDLRKKLDEYYNCPNHRRKETLKQEIINNVKQQLREQSINADFGNIDLSANDQFFLWHIWFYDVFDNGGFDVVIGNPPYVEAKKLKHIAFSLKNYRVASGTADLSIYFAELALKLCKEKGRLFFITTNKFYNTGFGKPLRKYLLEKKITHLIDFEQCEVFENVLVSSVILGVENKKVETNNNFIFHRFIKLNHNEFKEEFIKQQNGFSFFLQNNLDENEWSFATGAKAAFKRKLEKFSKVRDLDGVRVYRGVTTGYNPAFIISNKQRDELIKEDPKNVGIIKNMLQGRNIRKWYYNESDENLLFIPWHFPLHDDNISGASENAEKELKEKYPSIYNWLLIYKEELSNRNKEETGIRYEWYVLQRCAASYYKEFEKSEKIIWGLTADKWAFTLDMEQHYLPSNGYIMTSETLPIKFLLGLLNSNLLHYYFGFIGVMTAGGAYTLKAATIEALPIPQSTPNQQQAIIKLVDKILATKKANSQADTSAWEEEIDYIVYKLYGLNYDEVLVVDPETPITRKEYNNNN